MSSHKAGHYVGQTGVYSRPDPKRYGNLSKSAGLTSIKDRSGLLSYHAGSHSITGSMSMSNLATLGIFFGGLGIFFMGIAAFWWISLQDKWKSLEKK